MMSEGLPPRQNPPGIPAHSMTEGSYLDWPAILAGTVLALAISFLLISFGTTLGLSLTSPYRGEGVSAQWVAIAAAIWFAWVMVTGFGAGGYLAGRMRRRAEDATLAEVEVRDGGHGLVVWATGALISLVLAASGVGALVGAGGSAIDAAVDTATEGATTDYFANVMLRSGDQPAAQPTGETPARGSTVGQPSPQGATDATIDPAAQQQVAMILARSATQGEMVERDRAYLVQLIAANSDLDADAARARVDEITAEIDNARIAALDAVERARVASVIFGFIATATLLIGAVAAFFAATAGGRHRDQGLGFDVMTARR